MYPSNSLVNNVPALRVQSGSTAAISSAVNYTEPAYYSVSPSNAAFSYNVQIPLRTIRNTILGMNKNFYFSQITYLKIYFGPMSKIGFQSTSNNNPNGGTITDLLTTGSTITNLQIMLAIEQNQDVRMNLINQVQGPGFSMIIPYTTAFKNTNSGPSENISIQFDAGSGRTLQRLYHSLFNNAENVNTQYDCSNQNLTSTTCEKVQQYYTNFNGKRIQTITIDCTSGGFNLDYMNIKDSLKDSVIQNMSVFKYNWHHLDDFSNYSTEYIQNGETSLISGLALENIPVTWTFVGQNINNSANPSYYNHYTYGIFTKRLTVNATGPTID
jgi:hypothetical protein